MHIFVEFSKKNKIEEWKKFHLTISRGKEKEGKQKRENLMCVYSDISYEILMFAEAIIFSSFCLHITRFEWERENVTTGFIIV